MSAALSYNRGQNFSTAEVAYIQRVTGSDVDGLWGNNTVTAIEAWQRAQGVPVDGKVWRSMQGNTWPHLLEAGAGQWSQGSPGISRVALWTFSDALEPQGSAATSALERAQAAGATDIVFTISDDTQHSFTPAHSVSDAACVARRFTAAGISVGLNSFIYPSTDYVDALADYALELHAQVGLRRLDIDAEELWIKHGNDSSWSEAAARLGERLANAGFAVAVNGIVYTSHSALDHLVRQACVTHVTPQAYSTSGHVDAQGKPSRTYNPIDLQVRAANKWRGWWPDKQLIGGFASYRQAGVYELGTLDEGLAIGLALRTWADEGVSEVSGWSIKNISDAAAAVLKQR